MSHATPWALAASAAEVASAERSRLAEAIRDEMTAHQDWVLVDTCHRVELYGFGAPPELGEQMRELEGAAAVRRILRIAAGLESAVVGEDEVLHQVRDALREARGRRALDSRLQRLFEVAISAGRQSRAGRSLAGAGLAGRAVAWLQTRSDLADRPVLVAGAGRMGSALAHAARGAGASVLIASRNPEKAERLAEVYEGRGMSLAEGAHLAGSTRGVAVALAGVWNELAKTDGPFPAVADISAPTAIPPAVRERLNGNFLGVDDLFVQERPLPAGYVEVAERVVETKAGEYMAWLEAR